MTKTVAIIGGGYAGYALARVLDEHIDTTLIEAREAFVHNVAAIRAVADPNLVPDLIFPYDNLLRKGRVVRGRAATVGPGGVTLADQSLVAADIVVVATGSAYATPFKPRGDSVEAFAAALADIGQQVRAQDHVVIVGAGAVGVELAGELKFAFPKKNVSLVSNMGRLFPPYPQKLSDKLLRKLREAGVQLYLGDAVTELGQTDMPYLGEVILESGTKLAGLVVPVIGARIADGPGRLLPGITLRKNGQLAVDAWLRPSTLANVFAMGDLIDTGEGMTVVAATRQAPWLATTIRKIASGRKVETLPGYKPWPKPPILIPLGPKKGASVLPLSRDGTVVGDWLTAKIKGKELFIPRYRKEFGRNRGWAGARSGRASTKLER